MTICSAMFADSLCRCTEPRDHTTNHVCPCGGEWTRDGDPVMYPGGLTKDEALTYMLDAMLSGDEPRTLGDYPEETP